MPCLFVTVFVIVPGGQILKTSDTPERLVGLRFRHLKIRRFMYANPYMCVSLKIDYLGQRATIAHL